MFEGCNGSLFAQLVGTERQTAQAYCAYLLSCILTYTRNHTYMVVYVYAHVKCSEAFACGPVPLGARSASSDAM